MTEGGWTDAFDAARRGDADTLARALDRDPEALHALDEGGGTLLHVAAGNDDVPIAALLLSRGADLEAEARWGYTPFEWAAAMASDRVAAFFLERGADRLNLWTAAALGRLDDVRACFDGGRLRPDAGRSPRPGADVSGWPADTPYRSGDRLSDAFHIAARNGRRDVAEYLLARGAAVDATGYFGATALHWAAVAGREEIVRWLVENGADVTVRDPKFGSTPAGWAREGGALALAEFLEQGK